MFIYPVFEVYERPAGRALEIVVGFIVAFAALIFVLLALLMIREAKFGMVSLGGIVLLGLCAYSFWELAFRLVLNRKKENGGLFSERALKFWVVVFGISSIGMIAIGISNFEYRGSLGGAGMLLACVGGWRLAANREQRK